MSKERFIGICSECEGLRELVLYKGDSICHPCWFKRTEEESKRDMCLGDLPGWKGDNADAKILNVYMIGDVLFIELNKMFNPKEICVIGNFNETIEPDFGSVRFYR